MYKTVRNTTPKLDFRDVLIEPIPGDIPSRSSVNLSGEKGVPIIAANMDTVGTMSMARELAKHDCWTALHKHYKEWMLVDFFSKEDPKTVDRTFYTLGITDEDIAKYKSVLKQVGTIKNVCIDVANGYTSLFLDKVKEIININPSAYIMAGNVVTPIGVKNLAKAGVKNIKIGIGPGSLCHTRQVTGVGYPQMSAILECSATAKSEGVNICSDGGCQTSGDIAKAFAGGANWVMVGGILAGHTESEQEPDEDGNYEVYGMSSNKAMSKYGIKQSYRASEGKEIKVHNKGSVSHTISEILGGLRSSFVYVGADDLQSFYKRSNLILVNRPF